MGAGAARRDPLSDRFLADWPLREHAAARPEHAALMVGERRVSYRELDTLADGAAAVLRARGVRRGDRVLVLLDNGLEAVVAFYGALRADAVPSLLGAPKRGGGGSARRIARIAALAEAAAVVAESAVEGVDGALFTPAELVAAPVGTPERASIDRDLATICWTSGSTGEPKGVMLAHANLRASSAAIAAYLEHGPADVVMCVLPLSHTYGLFQLLVTHLGGGTLVLEKGFTMAFPAVQRMAALRVTGFAGVPTIFASILALKQLPELDLSALRYMTNAAYALPAPHLARLGELLPRVRFYAMYGQTECTRVCYLPPALAAANPASVGISMPNQEAWLAREDGTRADGPGEVGELVVRGANVMRGYWRDPEATARALRPGPLPGEVVLHTGDLFRLDASGYLHFVARKDDVIKTRGEKVAPREVEQAICALADVRECAVVGVPDPVHGVAVKAVVVLAPGAQVSADDVRRAVRAELDDVAVPRVVEFRDELPKTASGKVLRSELV
jgi:acyl-CoA synthetase (AMP-forming)/AMP-acid ligase II